MSSEKYLKALYRKWWRTCPGPKTAERRKQQAEINRVRRLIREERKGK